MIVSSVMQESEENRMHAQNLAIVWGPNMMRPRYEAANMAMNMVYQNQIMEFLLLEYKEIFRWKIDLSRYAIESKSNLLIVGAKGSWWHREWVYYESSWVTSLVWIALDIIHINRRITEPLLKVSLQMAWNISRRFFALYVSKKGVERPSFLWS